MGEEEGRGAGRKDREERTEKREVCYTYSLIFWSTSQGECQVTRSRLRKAWENQSESMFFSTPFISCVGDKWVPSSTQGMGGRTGASPALRVQPLAHTQLLHKVCPCTGCSELHS